jgi:site-specific DNA-methyltransferase (adenine-specific)
MCHHVKVGSSNGAANIVLDLSDDYVRYGRDRLSAISSGDPLEGSAEPTLSAPRTGSTAPGTRAKRRDVASSILEAQESEADALARRNQFATTLRGIKDAFARTYRGYSPDRVVVDPELNEPFTTACQELGLVGDARLWNTLLFRLRKVGRLIDLPTTERTSLSWEECDDYLFASEIALEIMLKSESARSVDEILCDPALAREFDAVAATFAPGFSSLQYRWAALKLRKQAKLARSRGSVLKVPGRLPAAFQADDIASIEQQPDAPGIYLVSADRDTRLYVGETVSLRTRLLATFESTRMQPWIDQGRSRALSIIPFSTGSTSAQMLAWQSCFLRKYRTSLNFRDLRILSNSEFGMRHAE